MPSIVNYIVVSRMYVIGQILKSLRENKALQLSEVQEATGVDATNISRIENGHRLPTIRQIELLAELYDVSTEALIAERESDKILEGIEYKHVASNALQIAEAKLLYGTKYFSTLNSTQFIKPLTLENRRYIGSKAKLTDWILEIIKKHAGIGGTFCDLFSGTGVVANKALSNYDQVIVNDLLYSNNAIYKGFLSNGIWNREKIYDLLDYFNSLNPEELPDNYFSRNFGGKYYEQNVAKKIGYIRQNIEDIKSELTDKEYNILIATLIYNIDRLANTVGHFDAYIKKRIPTQELVLRPIDVRNYPNVTIYREDANKLARQVSADIVYIDPPYNSRQYCRFYHLYETLVKWDKPELFGVALKPAPENMSRYCTVKAIDAFRDLVSQIDTKYLAISYNNTYNSKSSSSTNKIKLEEIKEILNMCGETKVFSHAHQYFNTGKTDFDNHREYLFITKIDHAKRDQAFASLLRW